MGNLKATLLDEIENLPHQLESYPFRYFYQEDFFTKEFHDSLCSEFDQVLAEGKSEFLRKALFSRFGRYDAYYWLLPPECAYPLNFFYQPEWRDFFQSLFDIPLTDDVVAEFHHHTVRSDTGFVHNDYNICCFTERNLENGINPWYYYCNFDPKGNGNRNDIKERMRSIALIYYMNNPEWKEEDGGETGLYLRYGDSEPSRRIPPKSNSLLAFEISPDSYHTFLTNHRIVRNSLIMWFHSDKEVKMARHGGTPPIAYE